MPSQTEQNKAGDKQDIRESRYVGKWIISDQTVGYVTKMAGRSK